MIIKFGRPKKEVNYPKKFVEYCHILKKNKDMH